MKTITSNDLMEIIATLEDALSLLLSKKSITDPEVINITSEIEYFKNIYYTLSEKEDDGSTLI